MMARLISVRPSCASSGGDPDIAGEGELEAAPQGEASDGRDDGLRTALHLRAKVEALARFAEMGGGGRLEELADVRPRAESPLARPRDDHRLDRVIGAQAREDLEELGAHGIVHGVEHVGTIEGEGGDAVLRLVAYGLFRHGPPRHVRDPSRR